MPNNVNEITSQSGGVNRTLTYDPTPSIGGLEHRMAYRN
jgi:hypothetical protein